MFCSLSCPCNFRFFEVINLICLIGWRFLWESVRQRMQMPEIWLSPLHKDILPRLRFCKTPVLGDHIWFKSKAEYPRINSYWFKLLFPPLMLLSILRLLLCNYAPHILPADYDYYFLDISSLVAAYTDCCQPGCLMGRVTSKKKKIKKLNNPTFLVKTKSTKRFGWIICFYLKKCKNQMLKELLWTIHFEG